MIDHGIVRGSKAQAVPLIIGKTLVYIHEDIHEVEVTKEDGETYTEWEYHEYVCNLDEYAVDAIQKLIPYTETKTAYIDDTSVIFYNIPQGNLTVYFPYEYTVEKLSDRVIISFEALEEVTDITISIL